MKPFGTADPNVLTSHKPDAVLCGSLPSVSVHPVVCGGFASRTGNHTRSTVVKNLQFRNCSCTFKQKWQVPATRDEVSHEYAVPSGQAEAQFSINVAGAHILRSKSLGTRNCGFHFPVATSQLVQIYQ